MKDETKIEIVLILIFIILITVGIFVGDLLKGEFSDKICHDDMFTNYIDNRTDSPQSPTYSTLNYSCCVRRLFLKDYCII